MMKQYDTEYVHKLEQRIQELETELRGWHVNGVWLTPDDRHLVYEQEYAEIEQLIQEREEKLQREFEAMLAER
jgi:hypothetical protein